MDTAVNMRVSPDTIRWPAERVLDMHAGQPEADRVTGRCAQCQRNGSAARLDRPAEGVLPVYRPVDFPELVSLRRPGVRGGPPLSGCDYHFVGGGVPGTDGVPAPRLEGG
jgi:hypothetical protein